MIENIGPYFQSTVRNAFDSLQIGDIVKLSDFDVTIGCETLPRRIATVLTSVYTGKEREFRR